MRQCDAERIGLKGLRDGDEKKEMPALPSWKSELSKIFSTLRLSGKPSKNFSQCIETLT
jgi:hypothetical protein